MVNHALIAALNVLAFVQQESHRTSASSVNLNLKGLFASSEKNMKPMPSYAKFLLLVCLSQQGKHQRLL